MKSKDELFQDVESTLLEMKVTCEEVVEWAQHLFSKIGLLKVQIERLKG